MAIFSNKSSSPAITYYTDIDHSQDLNLDGDAHIRLQDDEFVFAKRVLQQESATALVTSKLPNKVKIVYDYFVRLAPDLKSVYDPRVKYCIPDTRPDFVTRVCKNGEKPLFAKVNPAIFRKYLDFLHNHSDSQFKECNRLIVG
jgi:hypothetical protein